MGLFKSRGGTRRAAWRDVVIAEAAETTRIDGFDYFPPDSVDWTKLEESTKTSMCPWKGVATYYDVIDGDERLSAAAWSYRTPSSEAAHIKEHVAFWGKVKIS